MKKKKGAEKKRIQNKRALFDYELKDSYLVGVLLNGRETKNLRLGHGQLRGSYITIKDNELWLLNATISGSRGVPIDDNEVTRTRKLLANRKEIEQLQAAKQQGKTIVPTEIVISGRYIKVRIAVGVGRKQYDKRQLLQKRDDDRNTLRSLKNFVH